MINVLFVCHGNICRSPMAEFMFKDMVKKENLEEYFHIESRATTSEEIYMGIGNPIYPPAQRELKRHNINFDTREATKITNNDILNYDYILCMDKSNLRDLEYEFNTKNNPKVKLLLDYTLSSRDISDPWYSGDFNETFHDISLGLNCFLTYLKDNNIIKNK